MEFEIEKQSLSLHVVRCSGELRNEDGPAIQEELHPLIAEPDTHMILDLSGVTWLDSSGLSQLINLVTHARLSKSKVIIVGPTKFVAGVFEVTNLNDWFEISSTVDEALQRIGQSS